jgi:DNA-binding XRE family transcriptional regulator
MVSKVQRLAAELAKLDGKVNVREALDRALTIPMPRVLKKVPGETDKDKAKRLGVSRNTFYRWRRGERPGLEHARLLATLTGFSVKAIYGRPDGD